jgi:hypothetical protein
MVKLLGASDPEPRAAADDARALLERLGARPLLGQLEAALAQPAPGAPATRSRSTAAERVPERS